MKINRKTMFTSAMVLAMACNATAFAEDKSTAEVVAQDTTKIEATTVDVIEDLVAETPAYITKSGKIETITKGKDSTRVEIGKEADGLVMNLSGTTMILDRKTNEWISVDDLKEGIEVCAVIPSNAPMALSIPPMTSSVVVLVANADAGNMVVGKFDEELVNAEAKLKLNIDEKTIISDTTGAKKVFTAEDIKGQNALVFYDATTKSIPAQTTPSRVLILVQKEVDVVDDKKEIALREVAEKAGFQVTWIANDKPVIVEKEGLKIEVTLGEKSYTKNGETMNAADPVVLKEDKMFVGSDIANLLK